MCNGPSANIMTGHETSRSRIFAPALLEDRVCIVSGAGSGLGRAAALELARLGATVIGCGRREEPLADTVASIEAEGGPTAEGIALDIRDEEGVDQFFEGVLERHGRVDVLVNNAGGQFLSPAEAITPKGFRTVVELNVQGTWLMTHTAATKAFIPQNGGKVLSITISPHHGMPGMAHSGAARAAVENMMRTLSIEWARFNIKLCAIAAGQFDTEVLRTKYPPQVAENVHRTVPLQRLGTEEEMAWLIAYLASPAGDFFSGAVLTLDGARDNWFGPWPPPGAADATGEPFAEERRKD
jgi:NAD(P)-dependent dehydrogenase (short-subunit alcohol dehydrogenase family)